MAPNAALHRRRGHRRPPPPPSPTPRRPVQALVRPRTGTRPCPAPSRPTPGSPGRATRGTGGRACLGHRWSTVAVEAGLGGAVAVVLPGVAGGLTPGAPGPPRPRWPRGRARPGGQTHAAQGTVFEARRRTHTGSWAPRLAQRPRCLRDSHAPGGWVAPSLYGKPRTDGFASCLWPWGGAVVAARGRAGPVARCLRGARPRAGLPGGRGGRTRQPAAPCVPR